MQSLEQTLVELGSDKATERQHARDAVRSTFGRSAAVLRLDKDGNGKPWLALYQALFMSFSKELKACISKTGVLPPSTGRGSGSIKRLGDVASVIRWLTERSIERLNTRVLKSLLTHLTHGMRLKGELLAPVALDYAKTINSLLSYEPHLLGLKDSMWHELVALAYNVVLGRTPKRKLAEFPDEGESVDGDSDVEMGDHDLSLESDHGRRGGSGPSTPGTKRQRDWSQQARRGPSTIPRTSQPVSLEQIEFMSILAILLRSPIAPILSQPEEMGENKRQEQEYEKAQVPHMFPRLLLNYFSHFLRIYTGDTSLHHDYLIALSCALSHLTLNCRQAVSSFAKDSWHPLVGMWGTKNQSLKAHLLVVLRQLFPLLVADPLEGEVRIDSTEALAALWIALDASVHNRNLSFDSLLFRLVSGRRDRSKEAFVAESFQYGWQFDAEQALAWAMLELQADCAEKLYLRSESTYSSATSSKKRLKLENPVVSLMLSIKSQASKQVRMHNLQVLLFFIDRHWHALHDQLRREIIATLVPFVSFEDAVVQSWTFLCLTAIAHSECMAPSIAATAGSQSQAASYSLDLSATWDPIWTHAMRRANVPAVSRAACHAAHVLLVHSKRLLSSQRVLQEIESFVKDLDVQGPAYPYDSVCDFMVVCLRIANQDVRLYRMQMEEKVLSWLTESWRIGSERRTSMPLHTVAHIHALLGGIIGSPKRVRLHCSIALPRSIVVDALVEETETQVIRDFQLHARLPPYRRPRDHSADLSSLVAAPDDSASRAVLPFGDSADLAPPRGRERRLSTFLLKSLEESLMTIESRETGYGFPTAERIRSSIDLAVVAMTFEASLLMNGTQSNRRVLQAACKLLGAITPLLMDVRWKSDERRLMLDSLDPLIRTDDDDNDDNAGWETLVPPSERTGIRVQALRKLLSASHTDLSPTVLRRELQKFVFRSADVQDTFAELLKQLHSILHLTIGQSVHGDSQTQTYDDDEDGFGRIRTQQAALSASSKRDEKDAAHNRHIANTCITALAVVPILQSSSGEPTRDRVLNELILTCEPEGFLVLAPHFCEQIRRRTLNISASNLESLLSKHGELLEDYAYKRRDETQLLVIRILDATSHIWLQPSAASTSLGRMARGYCWQTVTMLQLRGQRSWRVQDSIIRFLNSYLDKDPTQEMWQLPITVDDKEMPSPDAEDLPAAVLSTLGGDDDIRLRLRVATTGPRLFAVGRATGSDLMGVYDEIRAHLCTETNNYESILTRLLSLGNMVISEASVRRGAYWHLLELAYFSSMYLPHLKAVLIGVAERMGIKALSDLFNCYAAQFAYSIRQSRIDVFKFPADLLGYRDRRECAEATFLAFTPSNLLAQGTSDDINYGKGLFFRHCQAIQKSEEVGIDECFAELVAYQIVFWLNYNTDGEAEEDLDKLLRAKAGLGKTEAAFQERFKGSADDIVFGILSSLGDQDVSPQGAIATVIESSVSDGAAEVFREISKYRALDTFEAHSPNLPFYSTSAVLRGVDWYRRRVKKVDSPAVTYHVLQQLFAQIELSPLVNEQYRLLNALYLWVACHHEHFKDESLLRTLTRRAVSMLAQVDLARGAQSLLEWCLSLYRVSGVEADYRLADVLIRISTIAHDFSQSTEDPSVVQLGHQLLAWAEKQADSLRKSRYLRKQVIRALAAWPRELPPSLQEACGKVQLPELTSVLIDHGVSASKFRLVRRIRDLVSQEDPDEQFSSSDFWRLKACIPPQDYLVDSDIDAFTSLLMLHCGQVNSIGSDQFDPKTVRTRHRKVAEERTGKDKNPSPAVINIHVARSVIIISLRTMMDTSSASQVHVAYKTLRTLMSIPAAQSYIEDSFPLDIRHELEYLKVFPKTFHPPSSVPDLGQALASEDMLYIARDFDEWIPRIATLLCEILGTRDPFFAPLTSVLASDHGFAEEVLPVLVHSLLHIEHEASASASSKSVRTILSRYFSSVLMLDDAAIPCYRAIISVVLHLRYFQPPKVSADALAHDKWLMVDFTLLSRCAVKCNAYTTALLFLELASDHRIVAAASDGSTTENILFEIYSHIDEPDGFYGIQTDDLRNFFVKRLRHENQWDKAFRFHGAVVESGAAGSSDTDGIVQALYSFGFNQLALSTMQNFSPDANTTAESSTLAYNLGWRAETWDLPDNLGNDHSGATLYLALRAVYRDRSPRAVDAVLRRAFIQEMNRLRDLGNENFTEIRQVTQNLMCLSQIKQWRGDEIQKDLQSKRMDSTDWNKLSLLDAAFEFGNVEAIMATRIALIRSVRQKEQRDQIGDLVSPFCDALQNMEKACLLCLSQRARDVNQAQVALNSIIRAQNLEQSPTSKVSVEFANVLWLMKEPKIAIKTLERVTSSISLDKARHDAEETLQHAILLARLGTWSAEASMKSPSQMVNECFGPAAELVVDVASETTPDPEQSRATILHQYAIFAERQYNAISKSPDALRWKLYIDRKKEEIKQRAQQLKRMTTNSKEHVLLKMEQNTAEKLLRQDVAHSEELFGRRASFLSLAVEMYARCLAASDKFDEDAPVRLCSLWLANFDSDDPALHFGPAIGQVPSRKFVFLAHQLTARLSKSEGAPPSRNQEALQAIIRRMGSEHPFHSLFPLYCLRSPTHASETSARRQSGRHDSPAPSQVERAAAASDVFNKLRSDPNTGERVRAVEAVCNASLAFAKHPIKHLYHKGKPASPNATTVPPKLFSVLEGVQVPVITAYTPIDPTTEYRDCIWIKGYESTFTTAGGVNLPKIIKCIGSNGKAYKQLFKGEGNDDLRQDAVMEQVFDLVNVVLRHDRETRKRKLGVRGYKVIPLASQAGVMEFVENTTPLAMWLRPAHPRYRPKDLSTEAYNKELDNGKDWRDQPQAVIKRFVALRERFRPVMRHYFTEKHKNPMSWFSMRLHYSRSVATTSIVGHILGLGDRHTSNILIDNKTGEVIHIDLGIAFEQGKLLPQPERVPFRLTADMIDGLGISGTQGVFQRCAEETLRVLRDGSETILTVLEVFKYDPLHSWAASEFKIKRAQAEVTIDSALTNEAIRIAIGFDMASGTTDEAADRALSTVARKLDKTLSVEYTVNELVTEASDPANLALMYIGWAPHW